MNTHTYTSLDLFAFFKQQYTQDGIWTLTFLFHVQANTILTKCFAMLLFHNLIRMHTRLVLYVNFYNHDNLAVIFALLVAEQFTLCVEGLHSLIATTVPLNLYLHVRAHSPVHLTLCINQFLLRNNSGIDASIQLYIFDTSGQFFFLLI